MLDALATFAFEFPAWTRNGEPLSWRHYQYGLALIQRNAARETLRMGSAARAGQAADSADFNRWRKGLIEETY